MTLYQIPRRPTGRLVRPGQRIMHGQLGGSLSVAITGLVNGEAVVGVELGYSVSGNENAPISQTWKSDGNIVATSVTFTPLAQHEGTVITVEVLVDGQTIVSPGALCVSSGDAFSEQSVLVNNANKLVRTDPMVGGDPIQALYFASVTLPDTIGTFMRPIRMGQVEHGFRRQTNGQLLFRAWGVDGNLLGERFSSSGATVPGDRIAFLGTCDVNSGLAFYFKVNNGPWTSAGFDSISSGILIDHSLANGGAYEVPFHNETELMDYWRAAVWNDVAPDISLPAVQDLFVNAAGSLVDPAQSTGAYGAPLIDLYGPASEWNDEANNNKGTGGPFTVVGEITDGVPPDPPEPGGAFTILTTDNGQNAAPRPVTFEVGTWDTPPVPDGPGVYRQVLHDVTYVWTFDDTANATPSAPLNMPDEWKDMNKAYGPQAFHVFRDPGSYTVTCEAYYQGAKIATETVDIVVDDADTIYAGTKTICVSQASDFAGAPAGAQQVTSFSAGLAALRSTANARMMLRAGEVFSNVSETITGADYDTLRITSFGAGAKPVIEVAKPLPTANASGAFTLGTNAERTAPNPLFQDVRFQGGWDAAYEVGDDRMRPFVMTQFGSPGWFLCCDRCEFDGMVIVEIAPARDRGDDYTFALNDCLVTNWRDYGLFAGDRDQGVGWIILNATAVVQNPGAMRGGQGKDLFHNDHGPFRNSQSTKSLFSMVDTFSCTNWSGVKPQGGLRAGSDGGLNHYVVIDRHANEGGPGFLSGAIDTGGGNLPGNYILDKLLYMGLSVFDDQINLASGGATLRNAAIIFPDQTYWVGIGGQAEMVKGVPTGADPDNIATPVKVHNVTGMSLAKSVLTTTFLADSLSNTYTNYEQANVVHHAPDETPSETADAPINEAGGIAGFTPRYQGVRDSLERPKTTAGASNGQTVTFAYPPGFGQGDFVGAARHFISTGAGRFFASDGEISVAFNAGDIVVTNTSGTSWPSAENLLCLEPTPAARDSLLDAAYASPAALPLPTPLPGSAALNDGDIGLKSYDDFKTSVRPATNATRGALEG